MNSNNIPVSFDFFKKYTYHEEWVDFMLKFKAKGNKQAYETLLNRKESQQLALRAYYEAFYLKPKIREKYHIRIKPVPKQIKEKLLSIPVQDACTSNENVKGGEKKDIGENYMQDVIKGFDFNNANVEDMGIVKSRPNRRILLPTQDVCEEDNIVEDDSEPLNSSGGSSTIQENDKINSSNEKDKEIPDNSAIEKDINKENPNRSGDVKQNNGNEASSSTSKKLNFNYKDLKPYIHCCPLTFKEFRKYSNIDELVKEFCEQQNIDVAQRRIVLERSYVLFYLAPEYRTITPIYKIQLLDNCPQYIKDNFFSIPTTLYLKERNNPNKFQKTLAEIETNINKNTNNENQEVACVATTSTINEPHTKEPVDVNQQNTVTSATNDSHEENKTQLKTIPFGEATDDMNINSSCDKNNAIQPKINSTGSTQTIIEPNNCKETNNNSVEQKLHQSSTTSSTETVISLPVTLDEFKKCTHYEEIVDKIFKIKAQENKELFNKYKNSQDAFEKTLENFYRAFYLFPAIREIWPIRIKPIPNFLKNRLLSVPEGVQVTALKNFKVEQLISQEFSVSAIEDIKSSTTEPLLLGPQAAIKPNNFSQFAPNPTVTTTTIENVTENSSSDIKSNSSLGGIKRPSNTMGESSSPKQQKMQQIEDHSNKKKSYNFLLPYAHCCPITFSEFCKYTNIEQLFCGYCEKRYNSLKKLPYMLKRAYILYYLAPENRSLKPFNKLTIRDKCPLNLRDKIFEIPTKLYLKGEKNYVLNQGARETETQTNIEQSLVRQAVTTNEHEKSKASEINTKEPIVILENRLLLPTTVPSSSPSNNESHQCSNIACVFHHISYFDFMKQTNILSILPEPQEITVIKDTFKKFICKLVKEQSCDKKYVVNCDLLCKLLKYKKICETCENEYQMLTNLNDTITSSVSENDRLSNVTNETVIEKCIANTKRTSSDMESASFTEVAKPAPVIDKSSIENQTEMVTNNIQTQQVITDKQPTDLWKHLRTDKIFAKFCQKLLSKLNQSYDDSVDFSSESYKIFLQCNEIPLTQILNDFCENNEDIVQRILKQLELFEALQRYYYFKYITNENFVSKYPAKIKQTVLEEKCNTTQENDAERSIEQDKAVTNSVITSETNQNSSNNEKTNLTKATNIHEETPNQLTLSKETSIISSNNFEKAKRIFFRYFDKTHTLAYVLRTSFGYKQAILRTVLSLTFKEFLEITNVYEGEELYADNHIAECMYRYAFRTPLVWPTNLYITLDNLCKFLRKNNIHFENYSTMLTYISPKLLHWSVLLSCTNFLDCVKIDLEKRTGKVLDTYDTKSLKHECIEYYNRCWKHEKWMGATPILDEEFYKDFSNDNSPGDVHMMDTSAARGGDFELPLESAKSVEAVSEELVCVEVITEMNTSSIADREIKEFNCVLLPNTQQQIEKLPPEESISNDPLADEFALNVSSSTSGSCEVVTLGELSQRIKTEPTENKLLTNILFYEDDNSNMQCLTREDEIVCLDNTMDANVVEENLPPSQIDFEETSFQHILSNLLVNSDDSNLRINLSQHFPSSYESNDNTLRAQHFIQPPQYAKSSSVQFNQLPDVSKRNCSENESHENVPQELFEDLKVAEPDQEQYMCLENDMTIAYHTTPVSQNVPGHQEAQRIPSALEDNTQMFTGNVNAEEANIQLQKEVVDNGTSEVVDEIIDAVLALTSEQSQVNMAAKQIDPSTSNDGNSKNTMHTNIPNARLPLRQPIKTYGTTKTLKNIATVKPLTKSGLVPQIQHNTRPLQTIPAYSASSSHDNQAMRHQASEIRAPTSVMVSLASASNSSDAALQSTQNSSFQMQLSNLGTHIYISQELNKNCSVFDNSSLLRIADHNYQKQTETNLSSAVMPQTGSEETPVNSTIIEEQQLPLISNTNQSNSIICPNINTLSNSARSQNNNEQSDKTNEQPVLRVSPRRSSTQPTTSNKQFKTNATNDNQQQACPRIVTRRSSTVCNTNAKVNNNPDLTHTNKLVTTIALIIHQPHDYSYNMIRKLCLYRNVIHFHYFKELTTQHISKYVLPSLEIGKSYTEALIACENFKTRISNRSISALFPFWSQNIQRDFLLVLHDLKEFHYTVYDRKSMQKQEDLRARILFWLLNTAPSFSLCQFIYDVNNSEFSYCESMTSGNDPSYKRKPFKCLTGALNSKILGKIKEMKKDLKCK